MCGKEREVMVSCEVGCRRAFSYLRGAAATAAAGEYNLPYYFFRLVGQSRFFSARAENGREQLYTLVLRLFGYRLDEPLLLLLVVVRRV